MISFDAFKDHVGSRGSSTFEPNSCLRWFLHSLLLPKSDIHFVYIYILSFVTFCWNIFHFIFLLETNSRNKLYSSSFRVSRFCAIRSCAWKGRANSLYENTPFNLTNQITHFMINYERYTNTWMWGWLWMNSNYSIRSDVVGVVRHTPVTFRFDRLKFRLDQFFASVGIIMFPSHVRLQMWRSNEYCVAVRAYVPLRSTVFSADIRVVTIMCKHIMALTKQFTTCWAFVVSLARMSDHVLIQLRRCLEAHRTLGALFRPHIGMRRL